MGFLRSSSLSKRSPNRFSLFTTNFRAPFVEYPKVDLNPGISLLSKSTTPELLFLFETVKNETLTNMVKK